MSSISSSSQFGVYDLVQRQQTYAQKNNTALQDRGTAAERNQSIQQAQSIIEQNHGFDAKQAVKEALTHNTKIINTPASQRGTLVNITA